MKRSELYILKDRDNIFWSYYFPWRRPSNWLSNIKTFFRDIKSGIQRAKYGVATTDCWDLDSYLLKTFKNGLISYRCHSISHPVFLEKEEWDNVLNRMIVLIDILQTDSDECPAGEPYYDKGQYDSWFEEVKKYEEYKQDCLYELCDLLKEYYWDLWW